MAVETFAGFDIDLEVDKKIWRYVDVLALVHLFSSNKLFFPTLASLRDPWEGAPGVPDLAELAVDHADREGYLARLQELQEAMRDRRTRYCVSCWYIAESESAAMWELYGARGKGLAIQSTVGDLIAALDQSRDLHIGTVEYAENSRERLGDNPLRHVFVKQPAYAHEQELRLVSEVAAAERKQLETIEQFGGHRWALIETGGRVVGFGQVRDIEFGPSGGVYVPIDVDRLVSRVVAAPRTQPWELQAVAGTLRGLGADVRVEYSELSRTPFYAHDLGLVQISPVDGVEEAGSESDDGELG